VEESVQIVLTVGKDIAGKLDELARDAGNSGKFLTGIVNTSTTVQSSQGMH
jgi:hypothetical protein